MNYLKTINALGSISSVQKFVLRNPSKITSRHNILRHINAFVYDKNPGEISEAEKAVSKDILSKVNNQIKEKTHSRLFAVIQLGEKRFKITPGDIIALNTYFPADVGERLRLEKVLAVGSSDFTLLGRPILSKDLIRIEATVIEKTYIVPRPSFRVGRVRYVRLYWFRTPYVLFCINSIEFLNSLDTVPVVENVQNRIIY